MKDEKSGIKMYGIKNCDTIKKARQWLVDHKLPYDFHDYKTMGIDERLLSHWCDIFSLELLLNKRGTTWKKLPASDKENINKANAIKLMIQQPSMIKRPILCTQDPFTQEQWLIGFKTDEYLTILGQRPKP